jgi:hypothetical protein
MLATRQPEELLAIARGNGSADIRNRAVQWAIGGDRPELAYYGHSNRGRALPPVWTKAYTALAGLYFDDRAPRSTPRSRPRWIRAPSANA